MNQFPRDEEMRRRFRSLDENIFITYPFVDYIMYEFDCLLEREGYGAFLLLTSRPRNGKTWIVDHYFRTRPQSGVAGPDADSIRFIYVHAPSRASERGLVLSLLAALKQTRRRGTSLDDMKDQLVALLEATKLRIIFINDLQHLGTGSADERAACLNFIKSLSEKYNVSVVGIGTLAARAIIARDEQLTGRFKSVGVPEWVYSQEGVDLLAAIEGELGLLRPSGLGEDAIIARRIFDMAEGSIGPVRELLNVAAKAAMLDGTEKITLKTLELIDWTPLSVRFAEVNRFAPRNKRFGGRSN